VRAQPDRFPCRGLPCVAPELDASARAHDIDTDTDTDTDTWQ
jgi:hypothetical protein